MMPYIYPFGGLLKQYTGGLELGPKPAAIFAFLTSTLLSLGCDILLDSGSTLGCLYE